MEELPLTKASGRLKVNIGAVLRTPINTGDYHLVQTPGASRKNIRCIHVSSNEGDSLWQKE
jgi:hypothetical protein